MLSKQCVRTVDCLKTEMKKIKFENSDLKFECDRLDKAYTDIID